MGGPTTEPAFEEYIKKGLDRKDIWPPGLQQDLLPSSTPVAEAHLMEGLETGKPSHEVSFDVFVL